MASNGRRPRHGTCNRGRKRRKKLKRRTRLIRIHARRARRIVRARGSRRAWKTRYWWDQAPLELGVLMRGLEEAYPDFTMRRVGRALVFTGDVELDTLHKTRRLSLVLRDRPSRVRPIVMADGPKRSRHRFYWSRPSSLCLWYAGDPDGLRWTVKDGIVGLIDLSRLHLIKEAWWRVTEQWEGWEFHSQPPRGNEQKPKPPSKDGHQKPSKTVRLDRQRCWCGSARYAKCHGAIPAEKELEILGLAPVPETERRDHAAAA